MMTTLMLLTLSAGMASAATVTNKDSAPIVLSVVENGNRMEVALDAGASQSLCPTGCFLTLPNGDRIGLQGNEKVDIINGSGTIK